MEKKKENSLTENIMQSLAEIPLECQERILEVTNAMAITSRVVRKICENENQQHKTA